MLVTRFQAFNVGIELSIARPPRSWRDRWLKSCSPAAPLDGCAYTDSRRHNFCAGGLLLSVARHRFVRDCRRCEVVTPGRFMARYEGMHRRRYLQDVLSFQRQLAFRYVQRADEGILPSELDYNR